MMALAALCGLVSFVCAIIILVHAFTKGGVLQGFLCLCIPFYICITHLRSSNIRRRT